MERSLADITSHSLCLGLTRAALTWWVGFVRAWIAWISAVRTALATRIDEIGIRPAECRVRPPEALARFEQLNDAGSRFPVVVVIGANPERGATLRAGLVVPAMKVEPEVAASVK